MIFRALAGVWPATLSPEDRDGLKSLEERFLGFIEKALREAKQRTDWIDSNEGYESVVPTTCAICFPRITPCSCVISVPLSSRLFGLG